MQPVLIYVITICALLAIVRAGQCHANLEIGGAECSRDFDCGNNFDYGRCRNNTCVCNKGYLNADCSYQAKSALIAGLLGIPLAVGMCGLPSLYVGIYKWGIPQLLIGVIPFIGAIVGSVFLCLGKTKKSVMGITIACVVLGFLAWGASWVWTLADAIQFGTLADGYKCDGNGYPLTK
ncbi:hypothetical protein F-S17_0298 [Faustovirus]|nr:hypothetical protein F-S17_0298 [Faustovirus]